MCSSDLKRPSAAASAALQPRMASVSQSRSMKRRPGSMAARALPRVLLPLAMKPMRKSGRKICLFLGLEVAAQQVADFGEQFFLGWGSRSDGFGSLRLRCGFDSLQARNSFCRVPFRQEGTGRN